MKGLNTIYDVVNVFNSPSSTLVKIGQIFVILVLIIILILIMKYIKIIKLEKRFSKYTINSNKNNSISMFDSLTLQYQDFIKKISKVLSSSEILSKNCKRYEKYKVAFNSEYENIDFYSRKIVLGFVYILFAIIVRLVESRLLQPIEMVIPFLLGYFTLDIIYLYKYSKYKKQIETDLYEAITLMNNSFKAGMSIIQAIDLVSKELEGPIKNEFKKISMELSFGLDIETSFKRFAERVNTDEAIYLSSSLSVLNKTGGNIIKVFDSIEKTILSKKKLNEELKALTASSKLIMYVLIFVPIVFAVFINIINNNYFLPLFTNPLGIVLVIIMVVIYILYIIIVRKVMNIRGIK